MPPKSDATQCPVCKKLLREGMSYNPTFVRATDTMSFTCPHCRTLPRGGWHAACIQGGFLPGDRTLDIVCGQCERISTVCRDDGWFVSFWRLFWVRYPEFGCFLIPTGIGFLARRLLDVVAILLGLALQVLLRAVAPYASLNSAEVFREVVTVGIPREFARIGSFEGASDGAHVVAGTVISSWLMGWGVIAALIHATAWIRWMLGARGGQRIGAFTLTGKK